MKPQKINSFFQKNHFSFPDLPTLSQPAKIPRELKITATQKPLLAIPVPKLRAIARDIILADKLYEFLDANLNKYYENKLINGILISHIRDFEQLKKYLDIYVTDIDNWGACDILSFRKIQDKEKLLGLAQKYTKDEHSFTRRVGLIILFDILKTPHFLPDIFKISASLKNEEHYYVNMANAWLVCECFIKYRTETLEFLKSKPLNKFTNNKTISKCRDSYRVSAQDKKLLLGYRIS